MSTRSYRGNRGKNVYEIANFSKGVNATNAAMPPGYLKELVNMNISPDGLSLRPREPYLNYALYLKGNNNKNEFVTLSNRVGMFVSKQFPNWEFIIDFFGTRRGYEKVIENYRIIDGDTFVDNKTGIRYRLLIVDAYELGTVKGDIAKGDLAKKHLESITNGDPITVRYDSQAPSWVDKYNRHLVWAETKLGLNIQRELIDKKHAKYLDLRVTEHEGDILKTEFDGLPDYDGNTLEVEDYPGGIPVVYRRDINQPPEIVDDRPSYILYEFNNIFMGDMLNDLEIGYSFVPDIKINKVNSEFGRYRTEYNPLEQNKMTNHDGIVALVDIDSYLPVEIEGPIITFDPPILKLSKRTAGSNILFDATIENDNNSNYQVEYEIDLSGNIISGGTIPTGGYVLVSAFKTSSVNTNVTARFRARFRNDSGNVTAWASQTITHTPTTWLTWQYNGTSSESYCVAPGLNLIGTSCSIIGETRVVAAGSVGMSGNCVELICK